MPDELLDKLGTYFVHLNIHDRHGITFERFVEMWNRGTWEVWTA